MSELQLLMPRSWLYGTDHQQNRPIRQYPSGGYQAHGLFATCFWSNTDWLDLLATWLQFYLSYFVINIVLTEYYELVLRFQPHPSTTVVPDFSKSGSSFGFWSQSASHCWSTVTQAQWTTTTHCTTATQSRWLLLQHRFGMNLALPGVKKLKRAFA